VRQLLETALPAHVADSVVDDRHLAKLAVKAGLLQPQQQLPRELRDFAALVATHCGSVVHGYEKDGGDAGEAISAYFELG
jgi:hypothetical protein